MTPEHRLAQLESLLAQDPANAALLADAVQQAVEGGLPEHARRLLQLADPSQAVSPLHRHLDALILIAEGRFDVAANVLASLREEVGEDPGILFNLGYAQFGAGTPDLAAETFSALIAREDAPEHALVWLLRALHHAGHPAEAVAAWNGLISVRAGVLIWNSADYG